VRIRCDIDQHHRAYGSGVFVRWGTTPLVLTARHVVKDAKAVWILTHTGKWHRAVVLNVDAHWDCAVLRCPDGLPEIKPCDLEFGREAVLAPEMRLESCGYGPDGKLACNGGLFLGYRRSSADPAKGPDDWFEISGHARPGDSGGPIFNARGCVVGILWGTNGEIVVGVQPGRIHIAIKDALTVRQSAFQPGVYRETQERNPTPPMDGPDEPAAYGPQPDSGAPEPHFALPGREKLEKQIAGQNRQIAALRQQIAQLTEAIRQAQQAPQTPAGPSANEIALQAQLAAAQQQLAQLQAGSFNREPTATARTPELSGIDKKLDDFLHKLPIQGPLTKLEEKQLESGHPLEKFFGASTAIVLLTVLGLGIPILICYLLYKLAHSHAAAISAALTAVPGIGPTLAQGFTTLDNANTAIDTKVQAALANAKADLTAHATTLKAAIAPPATTAAPTPAAAAPTTATSATPAAAA
jgi:hypothetical protein